MPIFAEPLYVFALELRTIITDQNLRNPKPAHDFLLQKLLNTPLGNGGDYFSLWPFREIINGDYHKLFLSDRSGKKA